MATTKISKKQLPIDVVYSTDLGDQISAHNLSPAAHQDIRDSLATATILPSYNSATHKITFTTIGGNTYEIDLLIEDAVDNVSYNSSTHIITVHKLDGTSSTIDLSGLIKEYTGGTNAEVTVAIDANNEITASINAVAASKISYSNTSSGLSGATAQAAIDELASEKVDKVTGKGLSTNDYTDADKTIVDGVTSALNGKVDKVTGKQLSTEDYTTAEKTKLSGIEDGAEANIIEIVKVNGTSLTPDANKAVDVTVPTQVSDLANDLNFIDKDVNDLTNYTTTTDLNTALNNKVDKVSGKQLSTEDYTTAEKNKLTSIENNAEENIIEVVKVNGTALTPDVDKAVDITIPAASEYTIAEIETTTGYAKSYQLKKDNTFIGAKIDIPKDLVISSGKVKEVDTPDVPYAGAQVGDKYIDLTLNDPTAQHIYIPVNELVDAYTGGNGIEISNANVVSAKVDSTNANGLSVSANGIALAAATTSTAGAMSGVDKTKLDAIESNADVNTIESISVNGTAQTIDVNKNVDITVPTVNNATLTIQKNSTTIDTFTANASVDKTINISVPTKTSELTNDDNVVKDANYVHTDNNYTNTEKTKLAGIAEGAEANVNADWNASSGDAEILNKPTTISGYGITDAYTKTEVDTALGDKVDKVTGKGLSTEDYTTAEKTKLAGIASGAQVNTIETIKINGSALTPDVNKAVDITVTPSQYETMPTAASAIEGKIVQYIGETTTTAPIYTNGYFYKCVESSETAGTYLWEEIDVMDVSDFVTAQEIQGQTAISGITILPADNSITYNMFTSDVKGRFVETFSGTTDPSSSLGKDGDIYFLID